jgi:hypothetical protein
MGMGMGVSAPPTSAISTHTAPPKVRLTLEVGLDDVAILQVELGRRHVVKEALAIQHEADAVGIESAIAGVRDADLAELGGGTDADVRVLAV